jgi:hypothetical protein
MTLKLSDFTKCGDHFTALPRDKCYPIMYGGWMKFFEEKNHDEVMMRIQRAKAFFVHVWNKMQDFGQKSYKLPFTTNAAYLDLAKSFCPKVYKTLVKYF